MGGAGVGAPHLRVPLFVHKEGAPHLPGCAKPSNHVETCFAGKCGEVPDAFDGHPHIWPPPIAKEIRGGGSRPNVGHPLPTPKTNLGRRSRLQKAEPTRKI